MDQIDLPKDSFGFVRRECTRCRRQFKTRPSSGDPIAIQRYLGKTVAMGNGCELDGHAGMSCFYCGNRGAPDEWLTPAQQTYLQRVARILVQHVRYEQMSHVTRTLSENPRPTYVPVRPTSLPAPMAPEQDDMRRFHLICCGDEVKAATGWEQAYFCPRCGTEHHDGMPRVRPQLQMVHE
jgi:hypothetical protein